MMQTSSPIMENNAQQNMDEIDLFDLFDDVKEQWRWLIGTGVICVLLALAYALFATPVYQAELVYKPTKAVDLLPLNQSRLREALGASGHYMTVDAAFKEVRNQALSGSTISEFYSQLLSENDEQLNQFIYNQNLTFEQNVSRFTQFFTSADADAKKNEDPYFKLKFDAPDAALSAEILNRFSQYVLQKQAQEVKEDISARIIAQIQQWELEVEKLRLDYSTNKQLRLLSLQEAAKIATSISQQRPVFDGERFAVGVQPPLYMMGEKALKSEMDQLNSRSQSNEDEYINGLPMLLWKIQNAKDVQPDWDKVKYVQVDRVAIVPTNPIKPKKLLIAALGVVAGGMIGIFMALLAAAWKRRKEQKRLNM